MRSRDPQQEPMDWAAIRASLDGRSGPKYWRSLEELAQTPAFEEMLHREFPDNASEWLDPVGRRQFLKVMAASFALAGLAGCDAAAPEKIVPYVRPPEELVPGKPQYYATTMSLGGYALGLLVESHMGRPTKVEGNPDHPASLGSTDVYAQASVLELYDPDRSQVVTHQGQVSTWETFVAQMLPVLGKEAARGGAGLRVLTETVTSPTVSEQLERLLQLFPKARWHQWEPAGRDSERLGTNLLFGAPMSPQYRFAEADVVLALDGDFLSGEPGSVRWAKDWAARRRVRSGETRPMSRLYVAEPGMSLVGAKADHRWPMRAGQVEGFARAVAAGLGLGIEAPKDSGVPAAELQALVRDLTAHKGRSLVVTGPGQPPAVHALAHAMNAHLGNVGATVVYTASVEPHPAHQAVSLRELCDEMAAGAVETLFILGGNPVYSAPADLDFRGKLEKVRLRVRLGLHEDETSGACHWHLPEAHALESWGDARAFDGTASIQQPLIAPLYGGRTASEVLAMILGQPGASGYDLVREHWLRRSGLGAAEFERAWRRSLSDGVVADTALPAQSPAAKPAQELEAALRQDAAQRQAQRGGDGDLEIVFRPDPTVHDGRFANNAWLQELPKPLTLLTWDNAALIAPRTAEDKGLKNGQVVELDWKGRKMRAPVWIVPGHAPGSVTVHLGYGRQRAGRIGTGQGFSAYELQTSDAPLFGTGLRLAPTGDSMELASTQDHRSLDGLQARSIIRTATLEHYRKEPDFAHAGHGKEAPPSLLPEFKYEGNAWGMSIDLNTCIGCSACTIACQAENNVPVVGKEQVLNSREMHWIRIDHYHTGPIDNPQTYLQPMACVHCEKAPCEVVCPVNATVHSDEGLNDMVYNRCVGTRYCSNNCPYKVRRFNFLEYSDYETPVLKLQRNPDVTVRTRGVMEKCTYCVQRISVARIEAKKQDRPIRDGDVVPACAQACPTEAIVFGNINDPQSRVAKLKAEAHDYGVLADIGTAPRTTYLASITNPNPEIRRGDAG